MTSRRVFDDLQRIYPISMSAFERLELYVARLEEWQKKTNLIAPSTLDDIWRRHVADSLQCFALKPHAKHWLDLGSGGGFPGLVFSALLADIDGGKIILVESLQKKTAFLRQVNRQMKGAAKVITSRIEEVDLEGFKPEIVSARALASLDKLLSLSAPWLQEGAIGLFHKGREFEAELSECDGLWRFDLINHESRISSDSVILEVSNLMRDTG